MRKKQLAFGLCAMLVFAASMTAVLANQNESKAKYSIKEVMKEAHKSDLLKKITKGEGNEGDKLHLLDLYISLLENTPPKGDMESWHNLAGKAVLAAAKVAVGRDGAESELSASTKCADCHKAHKK